MSDLEVLERKTQAMNEAYAHAEAVGREADIAARLAKGIVAKRDNHQQAVEALARMNDANR